ncbi:MAG: hypothetical protein GY737_30115, partial [Desulfobacteraceae bacterium]|nr:hypothetical protein [Desulfobacteraceae bacterium]
QLETITGEGNGAVNISVVVRDEQVVAVYDPTTTPQGFHLSNPVNYL